MTRVVQFVVRVGDLTDALVAAVGAVPAIVRRALGVRRYRRVATVVGGAYLILYLVSIRDIAISTSGQYGRFASIPSADVVSDWSEKLFAARAPFLYEPVVAIYPLPQLAIFVSPGNLLLGSLLAFLLALNVAVAALSVHERSCRRSAYTRLFAALPGFLMGFSCCVPTFVLVLGANAAAALVPVRSYLFPLAIGLMALTLIWSGRASVSPRGTTRATARLTRSSESLRSTQPGSSAGATRRSSVQHSERVRDGAS